MSNKVLELRKQLAEAEAMRDMEIALLAANGHTQQDIADKYGMTRQRAAQIIKRLSKKVAKK